MVVLWHFCFLCGLQRTSGLQRCISHLVRRNMANLDLIQQVDLLARYVHSV